MHSGVKIHPLTEVAIHPLPLTRSVTLDKLLIWFSISSSANESDHPLCPRVLLVIEKGASCSVGYDNHSLIWANFKWVLWPFLFVLYYSALGHC